MTTNDVTALAESLPDSNILEQLFTDEQMAWIAEYKGGLMEQEDSGDDGWSLNSYELGLDCEEEDL